MTELREKLLKEEFQKQKNTKDFPVEALLDISEDESKFLKELGLETIENLANNWNEHYEKMIKKIPKERVNSWIAASRLLSLEETEKVTQILTSDY